MRASWVVGVILGVLFWALSIGAWASPTIAELDFTLEDLDGNSVTLSNVVSESELVIVSFWQVG